MKKVDEIMDKVGFGWSLVIAAMLQIAGGVVLLLLAGSLVGCSGFHITAGTGAGIDAYARHENGLIAEGKATPDTKTAFWEREVKETENKAKPGWLTELFGGGKS